VTLRLLTAALVLLVTGGAALAATGTLDTGALTPQATGSRTAAEIMNTGAAARTKGGEKPPPPSLKSASPQAGMGVPGPAGNARPNE
jgi:hypothetical protein